MARKKNRVFRGVLALGSTSHSGLDAWGEAGYLCAGLEGLIFTVNGDTRVFHCLLVEIQFCRGLW